MRARLVVLVTLIISLLAGSSRAELPADLRSQLVRNGHALIIAVWNYEDPLWKWPQDIQVHIQAEVTELQRGLSEHFETVTPLLNPSFNGLRTGLINFFTQNSAKKDERLFVVYIGHGFPDPESHNGFITGIDTAAFDPSDFGPAERSAISMSEYDSFAGLSHARQILTVFDACFSGYILYTGAGPSDSANIPDQDQDRIRSLLRKRVRYYITAGDYNETIPADLNLSAVLLKAINETRNPR